MKFLILIMSLMFASQVHAFGQQDGYKAELQFNHGSGWQPSQAGTKIIRDTVHDAVAQYSFAIDGGAIAAAGFNLRSPKSLGSNGGPKVVLPKGAVVMGCYIDVITPLTTSASGTMALQVQAANDIIGATAAASYTGIVACTPTGTAATAIKLTADSTLKAVIATGAITAGKFNLHVMYVLSDE